MSPSNLEVIRAHYAATNRRDFERAMSDYADDVQLMVPSGYLQAGTFSGRSAVGRWFGDWLSTFHDARFDLQEVLAVDEESVLLVADHHARGRTSGAEVRRSVVWLYRLCDGKIVGIEGFDSPEEAHAALGLGR